jgi:hypothetical protein
MITIRIVILAALIWANGAYCSVKNNTVNQTFTYLVGFDACFVFISNKNKGLLFLFLFFIINRNVCFYRFGIDMLILSCKFMLLVD